MDPNKWLESLIKNANYAHLIDLFFIKFPFLIELRHFYSIKRNGNFSFLCIFNWNLIIIRCNLRVSVCGLAIKVMAIKFTELLIIFFSLSLSTEHFIRRN